jgi:hypothetical protein
VNAVSIRIRRGVRLQHAFEQRFRIVFPMLASYASTQFFTRLPAA